MTRSNVPQQSFAGAKKRKLRTSWSVKAMDHVSRYVITAGGIGTIIAIALMFLFLLSVVAPLFTSASFERQVSFETPWQDREVLHVEIDEYQTLGWALLPEGELLVFRLDTGEVMQRESLLSGEVSEVPSVTSVSTSLMGDDCVLGLSDGTLLIGQISFETEFIEKTDMAREHRGLSEGESRLYQNGIMRVTSQGQFRLQTVAAEFEEPIKIGNQAVTMLDHQPIESGGGIGGAEASLVAYLDSGELKLVKLRENAFSGGWEATESKIDLEAHTAQPLAALITERGDNIYFAWNDGRLDRFDSRKSGAVSRAEQIDLLTDSSAELTVCDFVIGRETLLVGDSEGNVSAWFRVRRETTTATDGQELTQVHRLPGSSNSAAVSMSPSRRSRLAAVGFADGSTRVYFVTTETLVGEPQMADTSDVERVIIAPKDNGLLAFSREHLTAWQMEPAYPETTFHSLFGKIWYEGYDAPQWQWQSSSAGVGSEMKLSMMPLIFGTLKATFYTMLFATPLALLAAIYTSEFLSASTKSLVKPTVESMASLPSVVLGFLAALVFAPYVEFVVPTVLASFLTVPVVLLLCAFLWHLLPYRTALVLRRYRFYFMLAAIAPGLLAAYFVGPWIEYAFFSGMVEGVRVGDMRAWLDGANRAETFGTGTGGWMLILLPLSALLIALFVGPLVNSTLRDKTSHWSRSQFAGMNLLKLLLGLSLTFLLAYGVSHMLTALGWDPRGSYLDSYEQRNALIVGMVMGFAVIPIIYTIADDALSAVPTHLRSASLGCGATPWQTAVRVVIPTAMSGLFSAVMVGLGRAVGETMIVLMAAGNTPIMDINLFSGLRTLSANIAVELPEAVPGDAHYRTLFLAALLLFLMTFLVNTVAELVRLRFRKRAYQL